MVCKKHFNVFDIQGLANPATMAFECDLCNGEIEEKNDSEQLKATQELHSLLMDQMGPLLRLLKKTDSISIPPFNPLSYLKQREAMGNLMASAQAAENEQDMSGFTSQGKQPEINVEIRDLETEEKANELPVWHTHSTITGEQVKDTASKTSGSDFGSTSYGQDTDAAIQNEGDWMIVLFRWLIFVLDSLKRYYESLHESALSPEKYYYISVSVF